MSEPEEVAVESSNASVSGPKWWLWVKEHAVLVVGILAGMAFLVAFILAIMLYLDSREEGGSSTADSALPTPLATRPPQQAPQIVGVSQSGIVSVTVNVPVQLRLLDQVFAVTTDVIGVDGVWQPNISGEGQAAWVDGTIVNYVFGLADTNTNETMLTQLAPGDEIILQTNGGAVLTFAFAERKLVPSTDSSVYAQQMPGVTIILLETDGSERLVVNGRYILSESSSEPSNVVAMGETVQLDNVQMTVNGATYIADRAEIPPGFAYFVVDYQIQNVGLTAFDTSMLDMKLVDEIGNQYALNPAASQMGNFPMLNGFLNANQAVNASAGYQVPLGLNSETVNWVVTNRQSGAQVFVTLPFTGGETAVQGATVSLFRADVSPDLTSLNLGGQVTNLGTQPLVITESDVQLRSEDGTVFLMLSVNPPLPWTVAPGQTVQFFVTYQRPPSGNAIFRVLNQEFLISETP